MSYSVMKTNEDNDVIYQWKNSEGLITMTCLDHDSQFQEWLKDNKDNLPSDIQKKIDDGELTIAD